MNSVTFCKHQKYKFFASVLCHDNREHCNPNFISVKIQQQESILTHIMSICMETMFHLIEFLRMSRLELNAWDITCVLCLCLFQIHHNQVRGGGLPADHPDPHHLVPPPLHVSGLHCLREEPTGGGTSTNHHRSIPGSHIFIQRRLF